jgi:hypothetical protein
MHTYYSGLFLAECKSAQGKTTSIFIIGPAEEKEATNRLTASRRRRRL